MQETNTFCAGGEHFSAGDECVENAHSNFSHTQTASYQQLPNRPWVEMIATHKYSPPKTGGITHLRVYAASTSCTYAVAFSAGLNGLQVDQVDRENDKTNFYYKQLVPSKLVAACNACVQLSRCSLTIRATTTQLLREKLRSIRRRMRSVLVTVSRP